MNSSVTQFKIVVNLALIFSFSVFMACGGKETKEEAPAKKSVPAGKSARGTPANPWVLGMSQCNLGEPWRVQMNEDLKNAAAAHPEVKILFKDAQNDSLTQRSHVEEFAAQKVDLLIISPKEATPLTDPVAQVYKSGIPVIVLDRAVDGDQFTQFIGADNVKIGREAGKYVAKILGGKGNIVEIKGLQTSVPGHDRHDGFMEGIKGTEIKTVFDADAKWLEPDARQEMESALSRFPQIDLVYGHNDPMAHGAWLAAQAAGREKQIKFIGIDALPHEGVAYVKQGILAATFQYPTGGAEAIDSAIKLLKGEKLEKKIVLGTKIYTAENADKGGEAIE